MYRCDEWSMSMTKEAGRFKTKDFIGVMILEKLFLRKGCLGKRNKRLKITTRVSVKETKNPLNLNSV